MPALRVSALPRACFVAGRDGVRIGYFERGYTIHDLLCIPPERLSNGFAPHDHSCYDRRVCWMYPRALLRGVDFVDTSLVTASSRTAARTRNEYRALLVQQAGRMMTAVRR